MIYSKNGGRHTNDPKTRWRPQEQRPQSDILPWVDEYIRCQTFVIFCEVHNCFDLDNDLTQYVNTNWCWRTFHEIVSRFHS